LLILAKLTISHTQGRFLHRIYKRVQLLLLIALTVTAAWLRFSAVSFGLPDQFRPDEEKTVPRALSFETDWNPHLAIYPAAQTYIIHGVLRSYAILTGSGGDLKAAYGSNNNAQAFLIARWISASMGTATVPVIYLAAAPSYGCATALSSAAIVTFSFIHVRESKFAKVEVPAGLWLSLSILMMLRICRDGRSREYVLAGFFCGLAAATHYTAGAIAIGIVVAHVEGRYRESKSFFCFLQEPGIYLAALIAISTFLCTDPYFILDWKQTAHDYDFLRNNFRTWQQGQTPAGFGWGWLFWLAMPAAFGIEIEIFLLAAALWAIFRPRPGTFALLAFVAVCFLTVTGGHPQLEFRYLVNPLLALALLGGLFAADVSSLICSQLGSRAGLALSLLAGAFLIVPSLTRDLQLNCLLRQEDTRTIARKWMVEHIPPGTTVALIGRDAWGKPKVPGRYFLVPVYSMRKLKRTTERAKWVVADSFPPLALWSQGPTDEELAELNSTATLEFDLDSLKAGAETPVFDPNDAFFVPFSHFTGMLRPGPRIRIWKITTPPNEPLGRDSSSASDLVSSD